VIDPASFATLAAFLRARSGHAIGPDKAYLLASRLKPLLRRHGLENLDALADQLRLSPAATLARDVVEAMTTNETFFFREPLVFEHLSGVVRALLRSAGPPGQRVRIWSAACSTGQEVCSIVMTLAEAGLELEGHSVEILGTDIDACVLTRAQTGCYSDFEVGRGLSQARLAAHFTRDANGWRMRWPEACVRFTQWNLLDDPRPMAPFDLILCRYVLIYFDPPTRLAVLSNIARVLAPGGVLYLGGMEAMADEVTGLAPIAGLAGAYRRR
jgi:chemotaxis protein methyltransferase CheR